MGSLVVLAGLSRTRQVWGVCELGSVAAEQRELRQSWPDLAGASWAWAGAGDLEALDRVMALLGGWSAAQAEARAAWGGLLPRTRAVHRG